MLETIYSEPSGIVMSIPPANASAWARRMNTLPFCI